MTGYERALRAMNFENPDRIPMCMDYSAGHPMCAPTKEAVWKIHQPDIITVRNFNPSFVPSTPGEDEWGNVWSTFGDTMGEVLTPPLPEWSRFESWRKGLPDFTHPSRYEAAKQVMQDYPDRFYWGGLGFMMMNIINFRGYENYMFDFYDYPDELSSMIDFLYNNGRDVARCYAEIGCHGVIAWEDWGLQKTLMISPALWRQFFKKKMGDFVAYLHGLGLKYVLHCCGYIEDILEDLLEIGVDVLQLDQQLNMGFELLGRYAGKFCFACPVDIQHSPDWTQEESARYAGELIDSLTTPNGGFIYKAYSQPWAIGLELEQCLAECATFGKMRRNNKNIDS